MSDVASTRLLLVRHGESVSTVTQRIGGHRTCGGLSPLGVRQAEALRDRMASEGFTPEALYTSNFRRAIETAEIIAPAIGNPTLIEEPGFGEHDPGPDCDGLLFAEFVERHGNRDWDDPFAESFPGGETVAEFHYRVGRALHQVIRQHAGETVVIACHGGAVDAVFRTLLRLPMTGSFQLHTLNTAITEFQLVAGWGGRGPRWQLNRYNDTAHLAGLPVQTPR